MIAIVMAIALEVCLPARAVAASGVTQVAENVREQIGALSSPDPVARAIAACRLRAMGNEAEDAVPELMRLLADSASIPPIDCWGDRTSPGMEAARTIGAIASPTLIEPLMELLRSPNPSIRRAAARALGGLMRRFR
jgi:HEAT repeat protein